jgi:hypothetical protein
MRETTERRGTIRMPRHIEEELVDSARRRTKLCANCKHPQDWHRFDDAQPWGVTDIRAKFRCIGYDCEVGGPPVKNGCDCPDFMES